MFRSVRGNASQNGAELFEIEADFSAKIVTFRLVHPPPSPPPLNPPLARANHSWQHSKHSFRNLTNLWKYDIWYLKLDWYKI